MYGYLYYCIPILVTPHWKKPLLGRLLPFILDAVAQQEPLQGVGGDSHLMVLQFESGNYFEAGRLQCEMFLPKGKI
jgi:hypothetical protein